MLFLAQRVLVAVLSILVTSCNSGALLINPDSRPQSCAFFNVQAALALLHATDIESNEACLDGWKSPELKEWEVWPMHAARSGDASEEDLG
ncbi:hypothetical protein J3F83DRAFT_125288 [Trichoderma novae-zelandiae]